MDTTVSGSISVSAANTEVKEDNNSSSNATVEMCSICLARFIIMKYIRFDRAYTCITDNSTFSDDCNLPDGEKYSN